MKFNVHYSNVKQVIVPDVADRRMDEQYKKNRTAWRQ